MFMKAYISMNAFGTKFRIPVWWGEISPSNLSQFFPSHRAYKPRPFPTRFKPFMSGACLDVFRRISMNEARALFDIKWK